jgi:hypothetical protein
MWPGRWNLSPCGSSPRYSIGDRPCGHPVQQRETAELQQPLKLARLVLGTRFDVNFLDALLAREESQNGFGELASHVGDGGERTQTPRRAWRHVLCVHAC